MELTLIEKIAKYNIALRHLPTEVVEYWTLSNNKTQRENELREAVERVQCEMSEERFAKLQKQGCHQDSRMVNGCIIRKFKKVVRQNAKKSWYATIENNLYGSVNFCDGFGGDTAEEAVDKAIAYIEKYNTTQRELYKKAGLKYE